MTALKPRDALIVEPLVDVLRGFDCDIDEARDRLADALTDFVEDYERRAEEQWLERQQFGAALASRCDAEAAVNAARGAEMTIDTSLLDALGDNWMVRTDEDGAGYGGFRWAPVGEWTECPRWSDETTADCESGGLFGQGPGGYGYAQPGTRFVFCETGTERMPVGGDKVKVRRARIIYTGADAIAALRHVCGDNFSGSLYLSGCTLPDGLVLPQTVGGGLDLRGCTLPEGLVLPQTVGGGLYLSGCTLPEGLALPQTVGGGLYLSGCTLPEGVALPQTVGDRIYR